MAHPLHDLAQALSRRTAEARSRRKLNDVLRDPHLAQDVGLPPRPKAPRIDPIW